MSLTSSYLFSQVPSAAIAYWAFKLHKNKFSPTNPSEGYDNLSKIDQYISHDPTGGIFGAGVCKLGKIGAWAILITLFITFWILVSGESTYNKILETRKYDLASKKLKGHVLSVIILNSIVFGLVFILSVIMNPQLFVRTIPFYSLQVGILCSLGFIYTHPDPANPDKAEFDTKGKCTKFGMFDGKFYRVGDMYDK